MYLYILFIVFGFVLLIKGADILVEGASIIAKKFNIPEIIIGLTVVAIGTAMPELVVSVKAAVQGHTDLAIGNIVGSNMSNLFLILGSCSIIKGLRFKKETKLFEAPFLIFCTGLFFVLANNGKIDYITRKEGLTFLIICLAFIMYNVIMSKRAMSIEFMEISVKKNISVIKSLAGIIMGIIFLKYGGDLVVNNSCYIAKILGVSEKMISLTIVAFSTSLPELITSITATCKGDTDIAIGNILGSQIFNILLIIGVAAVLNPIKYTMEYNSDLLILIAGTITLFFFPFIGKKDEMTRLNGLLFLIIYVIYVIKTVALI